jgi:predicted RNA-binding protein with PIN domain
MNPAWLIIDGYSLLHRFDPEGARRPARLQSARQKLVRHVEEIAAGRTDRVTIVFDGREAGGGEGYESPAVEILFSSAGRTADAVIERLVQDCRTPETILVVSSDRLERQTVSARGAQTMGCGDFLAEGEQRRRHRARSPAPSSPAHRPTLGEFFPDKD